VRFIFYIVVFGVALAGCGDEAAGHRQGDDAEFDASGLPDARPVGPDDATAEDDTTSEAALDAAGSGPSIAWSPADGLGPCEASDRPAPTPVTQRSRLNLARAPDSPRTVHLLDIEGDEATGLLYTVGSGGLFVIRDMGDRLEAVTNSSLAGVRGSFDKVEVLDEGLLSLSSRSRGLTVLDGSRPGELQQLSTVALDDASGMAWSAPYLYVTSHLGEVKILDLSDPRAPENIGTLEGLGNPWEIRVIGQRGYVADNTLGVVVLDLTDPIAPQILRTVETSGGAQDLWIDAETLYVAVGSAGVEAFSLVDPDSPAPVSLIDVGSSVVSVTVANGTLWASDHESVIAVDVRSPEIPLPLGAQRTAQWAMHVYARDDVAFVADWGQVAAYGVERNVSGPDLDVSRRELFVVSGDREIQLSLTNRGSTPLRLLGAGVDDPRFRVEYEHAELNAGESGLIRLLFADDGESVQTTLCLATNDGDEGLLEIPILTNPSGASAGLGEPAPDFVLRDIDGETHQLSAQLGYPVVLIYFATW
jgi:hypothetical protein